jgi:hypothetical protein
MPNHNAPKLFKTTGLKAKIAAIPPPTFLLFRFRISETLLNLAQFYKQSFEKS